MDFYYLLLLILMIVSSILQGAVHKRFNDNNARSLSSNMTGREVAEKILNAAGITDVTVKKSEGGALSDHYHPMRRELRLSAQVMNGNSIAAASVAAHEAAHALQHAESYKPLVLRSACASTANFGSRFSMLVLLLGIFLSVTPLLYVGAGLYALVVFFTLITLPVEFNASRRALTIMKNTSILNEDELRGAKSVLSAAAMTYVVSALSAIVQFLRLIALAARSKRRD